MAWYDIFRTNRSAPAVTVPENRTIEYDPETGLTREQWDMMPPEMRAILPWNIYGNEDVGSRTNSGTYVNEDSAFKMGVVFAAITLIADGVSSLPPKSYTIADDGNRTEQPIPQWIRKPHPEIRRFDIFGQLMISVLAWGNGYASFARRPSDGVIIGLNVLDPATVTTEWDPNKAGYRRYRIGNQGPWLTSYDIFHIQGPTLPGDAAGMSVIRYARESIGLGMTLEEYGARYFGQGSQAKIVLEIPNNVDEPKAKDIVRTFERFHKGKNNWHRPAIVSGGAKLHMISIPPDDAQFLQSREHQAIDIARWFRVPPHRVGIVSASTSWGSGLAEENMAMLQHTYRPWILRLQDALTAYAPGGPDLGTLIELDAGALLQGTFGELADMWTGLYEKDIATKNESRLKLGLSKVADGDKFFSEVAAANQQAVAKVQADGMAKANANANPPNPPDPAQAPKTDANAPGDGGRTPQEDKARKQKEAARSLMDVFDDELEARINTNHDKHNGQFASKEGMSVATPDSRAHFKEVTGKSIPPAWTDVQIADDLGSADLQVLGRDAKGRRQAWYSKEHTQRQAEKKFQRIKELQPHLDKLDSSLDRDALVNDEAGALTLIRRMGMRPGSNANRGASTQAHGATNLKSKHVSFDGDHAILDFTGKDGVHITLKTKDPKVVDVLRSRKIGKSDDEQLFNTNEDKVRKYMNNEGGVPSQFLLKDLRTTHANVVALKAIKDEPAPKTKAEFIKARKNIATKVSTELGNDPSMALNSYINPTVFTPWVKDGSWV
jgi:HK97 family phage portal protein